jgi:hypothetical protein
MVLGYEWQSDANCLGLSWRLERPEDNPFFQEGRGKTYKKARKFCASCPVVIDCLVEAMRPDTVGFWGGLSHTERVEVRMLIDNGWDFKQAVEALWAYHREKNHVVPPSSVWEDWQ